jgi:hypothetical protein
MGGSPVPRIIPVLLLLAACATAQETGPKTEMVLDNASVRVFRATIPAHKRLLFQTTGDVVVVRLGTHEAAFLPGSQVFKRPNQKNSEAVDLIVELKQHVPGKMKACVQASSCSRDTIMNGKKVGEALTLFSNGYLTATRQQVKPGTAISTSFNSTPGTDQVLLIPFTDLRANVAGADQQLKAGEPFFTDAAELQVGGANAEGKWIVLRLHAPAQ